MKYSEFDKNNIAKIKITYNKDLEADGNNSSDILTHSFTCVPAKILFRDEVIIIDIKNLKNFNIPFPQRVFVNFIKNDAVYQFRTKLEDITKSYGIITLTIKKPDEIERIQLRQYYRVATTNLVILNFKDKDGTLYRLSATSVDISLGGIKIYKTLNINENQEILEELPLEKYSDFEFLIYINNMKVHCKGKFIRSSLYQNKHAYSFEFNYIDKSVYTRFYRYLVNQQCKDNNIQKNFS